MIKIVVISHGSFCEGLLETLKMVGGSDFGIKTVPLIPGEEPESYREKLASALDKECETIILSDIAGGTPFQSALYLSRDYKMALISGMNLPMLLTLALECSSGKTMEELCLNGTSADSLGIQLKLFKEGEKKNRAKLSINKN